MLMEDLKPVLTELYGFESRDKSLIIASLDFQNIGFLVQGSKYFVFQPNSPPDLLSFRLRP